MKKEYPTDKKITKNFQMLSGMKNLFPDKIKTFIKRSLTKGKNRNLDFPSAISECLCCGSISLIEKPVLWEKLIRDWQLSDEEVIYINHQQGLYCQRCKVNMRGMAIAYAMMRQANYKAYFKDFVTSKAIRNKKILEVNEAAWLTKYLKKIPGHILAEFPEVDMQAMPYPDSTFDIVVHSDTLEHVPDPLAGMRECYRVLVAGGYCVFTVPMVVGRLTKSRAGLPPSFHGSERKTSEDYIVHTEFGSDAWTLAMDAGFSEVQMHCLEYPAAISFLCLK